LLERLLGLAASLRKDEAIAVALGKVARPARGEAFAGWQFAALDAFLDALDRRNTSREEYSRTTPAAERVALPKLEMVFAAARRVAGAKQSQESERLAAIRVLGRLAAQRPADIVLLGELLRPENSAAIHQGAVASLVYLRDIAAADALLAGWRSHSPTMREDVLAGILSRPDWVLALLAKIESDAIPARQINAVWQQKLLKHWDPAIRERSTKLFAVAQSDRRALLKEYAGVGKLKGDAGKGLALFRQHCAACHRLGGDGKAVGPDLGMMADKSVDVLVAAILDPNQAVESRYVSYTAVTRDEREMSGVITAESANSITLRSADGREDTLLRADLKELTSSGLSLMPEGFEHALKPQDLADLIASLTAR
jgi:putative heme-binding domain-containing protein